MKKIIIFIAVVILSYFFPWLAFALLTATVFILIYFYYAVTKRTKKYISYYKDEIIQYFDDKIGSGNYHYTYVSKHSLFFLYPAYSRLARSILQIIIILLLILGIIYFFKYDNNKLLFSILLIIMIVISFNFSTIYAQPENEYQIRNTSTYSEKERLGLELYPDFFYYGAWNEIQKQKNEKKDK